MRYFFIFLFCLIATNNFAQVVVVGGGASQSFQADMYKYGNPNVDKYEGIEGNPYFSSEWLKGDVKLVSGQLISDKRFKFDEVENVLLVKGLNDDRVFTFTSEIHWFVLKDKEGEHSFVLSTTSMGKVYLEVLNSGNVELLKRNSKTIEISKSGYGGVSSKSIVSKTKFYLSRDKETPIEIRLDPKSIIAELSLDNVYINYIKTNKLNLKKEEDVILFLNHYNSSKK